jgi:cytochrome c-type biogenesis protein CcsB
MISWEAIVLLLVFVAYVCATVCFSLRYWLGSNRLVAIGVALTGMALSLHTGLLILRGIAAGRLPFSNLYEFTLVFAWATMLVFIYCAMRFKLLATSPLALSLTTLLIGFASMMPRDIRPLMPALRSVWLQAHVATGILAYGALAVSAVLSVVMLTTRDERVESDASDWAGKYWRMPSQAALERYVHGLIVFGFIFLSLLIVTGAVWAEETWGRWWGWDPKEAWALVTWLIYLIYLHGKNRFGWQGQATAWFSAIGFLAVMFTLFGVTYLLPGLHSYK